MPEKNGIKLDYKAIAAPRRRTPRRIHWLIVGALIPVVALVATLSTREAGAIREPEPRVIAPDLPAPGQARRVELDLPLPAADELAAPEEPAGEEDGWNTVTVRPGDSLARIFDRRGIPRKDLAAIVRLQGVADKLSRLHPGDRLRLRRNREGGLLALERELNERKRLRVSRTSDGFRAEVVMRPIERRVRHASGVIETSLFEAGRRAGMSGRLVMQLSRIFAWDVDFVLDIRRGDRFVVIYEEIYRGGGKLRDGPILAAEFHNRGRTLRAIRFEKDDGQVEYYTPEGRNVRKAFIRTPVDFTRITSRFNPNRLHPVHGYRRPHEGVDYAAPPGTAVKAAGAGRVIFRGTKGGYGNTLVLKHAGRYTTLYAHMRGFARGAWEGARVEQGEVIGYVGQSGLATGPHLHYEFRVNGRHKDPLTVNLPSAEPIADRYRDELMERARPLIARLELLSRTQVASRAQR